MINTHTLELALTDTGEMVVVDVRAVSGGHRGPKVSLSPEKGPLCGEAAGLGGKEPHLGWPRGSELLSAVLWVLCIW